MDIHFGCTSCGKCCQNLRVPLTVAEAAAWAERGHVVELLMDALVENHGAAAEDEAYALYRRERAFAARSGDVPVQITVTLAAQFDDACPNLASDLRCTIYEARPLACRIYPAEFNPFVPFDRARKGCPPEAWAEAPTADHALMLRNGHPAAATLQRDVMSMRAQTVADVPMKAMLCGVLGVHAAAVANEGLLVFRPRPSDLRDALAHVAALPSPTAIAAPPDWTVVTNRRSTLDVLTASRTAAALTRTGGATALHYLGFLPDEM